jgi:exoribonuclease R
MFPATIELNSKVRYGMTSRGVPLFRAIPFDTNRIPVIAGCSERNTTHALVGLFRQDSDEPYQPGGSYPRATLVRILGRAGEPAVEEEALLWQYSGGGKATKYPEYSLPAQDCVAGRRKEVVGTTFHIDPQGCRDVDDVVTLLPIDEHLWQITITISDVAAVIPPDSPLDLHARKMGATFYSDTGTALRPMLPRELSEDHCSLLPSTTPTPVYKKGISLSFQWDRTEHRMSHYSWKRTVVSVQSSYTYEEADQLLPFTQHFEILEELTSYLQPLSDGDTQGPRTSHEWIEALMLLYNTKAGVLLKSYSTIAEGILRVHSAVEEERAEALRAIGAPEWLAYQAARYVSSRSEGDTIHASIGTGSYAHASSPIRRYADLVNQRAIHAILDSLETQTVVPEGSNALPQDFAEDLNTRQRANRSFSRDIFFVNQLTSEKEEGSPSVLVNCIAPNKFYVPPWKRIITVHASFFPFTPGERYFLDWYVDLTQPCWKKRMVFRISSTH